MGSGGVGETRRQGDKGDKGDKGTRGTRETTNNYQLITNNQQLSTIN
ncbi:hypothetical protein [Tolypothrix sp. VBCCA 56010]